jgi:DNA-binding NarL/FixJ family response regulator
MTGVLIRFLIVRAWIRVAAGDPSGSRMDLLRAHELGDPLRFVRSFIDEPEYSNSRLQMKKGPLHPLTRSETEMIVCLTSREEEILILIKRGLSNSEIAAQLSISLSTVKKHTTSIFRKMGVTSRSQAIVHSL